VARQKLSALASFWRWLDDCVAGPGPAMATLTGRDLEDYHRHVLATTRSRSQRAIRKSAVRLLWSYRRQVADGLAFDPSRLDDWAAHLRRLTTDNARLREELEAARAVSHLDTARATRKRT
jgi:hypothetical protein